MANDAAASTPVAVMVAVAGPTAGGKSVLAIHLAQQFDGEVINSDAMQVYRGFDIGTAKLASGNRGGIPHHLIDICEPDEIFSAGEFAVRARDCARAIADRGKLPIVAGGTGFYLRAFLDGLFEGPQRDEILRSRLKQKENLRPGSLHKILLRLDPEAGARIHLNDTNKVIRALEVCLSAQRPMTQLQRSGRVPFQGFRVLKLFLDPEREAVYQRINQRCEEMFRDGLLDEVRSLITAGVLRSAQAFRAVGYREALAVLDREISIERAIALTQQATRRYAKRQWTWFRRESDYVRLQGFGDDPSIQRHAFEIVGELLKMRGEP